MNAEREKVTKTMDLHKAHDIMGLLGWKGVDTVLYGSLGVSVYLGNFKEFGDADLLVAPEWMGDDWGDLQEIMTSIGFRLVDEKEHEFRGADDESVAFAPLSIFDRDGIEFDPTHDIVDIDVDGATIKTFSPALFRRAYEYSVKDGYRSEERGKKDQLIIDLLDNYMTTQHEESDV